MKKWRSFLAGFFIIILFAAGCAFDIPLPTDQKEKEVKVQLQMDHKALSNFDAAVLSSDSDLETNQTPEHIKLSSDDNGYITFKTGWREIIIIAGKDGKIGAITINLQDLFNKGSPVLENQDPNYSTASCNLGSGLKPKDDSAYFHDCKCGPSIWKFRRMCCKGPWYSPYKCFWVWHTDCNKTRL